MKRKTILRLTAVYACILLSILLISVSFLLRKLNQVSSPVPSETAYIYVYVSEPNDTWESIGESDTEAVGWMVREHNGKIGIFTLDGTLIKELDTYIKTLPEADRRLLGEGICVRSKAELNSLIEDYTE